MNVLREMRVVDLGVGMGAALVAKFLVELGASTQRLEPPEGDPFYDIYEAYRLWQAGKQIDRDPADSSGLNALLAEADICLVGGEDYPGLNWTYDADALSRRWPRLVVLDMGGYVTPDDRGHRAVDLLVQARTGIVYEHYTDRPMAWPFPAASYGVAVQGIIGLLAALYEREGSGAGQVVRTSMQHGALTWFGTTWCTAEHPDKRSLMSVPKNPRPTIFQCRDGVYIHLVLGTAGGLGKLQKILGIDNAAVASDARGLPTGDGAPKDFFGNIDLWAGLIKNWDSKDLLDALWREGMAAEKILPPGGCWDDPQVEHNGILMRHPSGERSIGLPFRATWPQVAVVRGPARANAPAVNGAAPLAGVRVLDLGNFIAGPFGGTVLSDLGAEVIKIEPPQGDPMRILFRAFLHSNRGKRVMSVDIKVPEGLEIVRQQCAEADVVLSNFRPGVSARLGVDPDSLQAANPELIVQETSGYGPDGPRSKDASFDMVFLALCGHEYRAGGEGNPPLWYRTAIVDVCAGLFTAIASLAGLLEKRRHGRAGARLTVSMLDTGLFLMSELFQRPDGKFGGAPLAHREQTGFHPAESLYRTKDGWIAIAARTDAMAVRLAKLLGLDEQASVARRLWGDIQREKIASAIAEWRSVPLLELLAAAEIWSEECRVDGWEALLRRPEEDQGGLVVRGQHETYGMLQSVGPGIRFSRSQPSLADRGSIAEGGEHTRILLGDLGYESNMIEDLYRRKVVS